MRATALWMIFAALGHAQHGSSPAVRIDQASDGARLFRAQCAGCHGADGSGSGAAPALNTGRFRHGSTDEAIVRTISKGVPGTTMPAFNWEGKSMWQLVAHIRSLAVVRAATSSMTGDAKSGEPLFATHCSGCHTPAGAWTAPDLYGVASRLTVADIRASVLEPNAVVSSEYWQVSGTTAAGQRVEGIRLNEDTSSIQLRDARSGRLSSVLKKDLTTYEIVRKSPMPSFSGKLTPAQVNDIVAYLVSGGGR